MRDLGRDGGRDDDEAASAPFGASAVFSGAVCGLSPGAKYAMSSMRPIRAAPNTACTRSPVEISDGDSTETACSSAVSAPSSRISAHAKGLSSGCPGTGSSCQVQLVTVPTVETSANSVDCFPVTGSNSAGGTETLPSLPFDPTMRPSRSASANWLSTGPSDRV